MHEFQHLSISSFVGSSTEVDQDLFSPGTMRELLAHAHQRRVHSQCLVLCAASARPDLPEIQSNVGLHYSWPEVNKDRSLLEGCYADFLRVSEQKNLPALTHLSQAGQEALTADQQSSDELIKLLRQYASELIVTNEALNKLATSTARELVGRPGRLVSGLAFANMLQISEEAVRQRHQAGKLIAILQSGRERGRGFPVFQAWTGVAGAPLEQILGTLGYTGPTISTEEDRVDATDVYQFFIGRNEMLGGFTPVEALTGAGVHDASDSEAAEFLARPHADRLAVVMGVARSEARLRAP